ncbi:MAG: glucokinase [Desulfobacterales bacterium]|jgi:glucokinase
MPTAKTKAQKKQASVLAGDIGGTKTRLGLFVAGKQRPVARATAEFSSREASSLEVIIDQMLARYPAKIKKACFGIAGPVINGVCRTTNLPWVVSEQKLQKRFGWQQVRLINDLRSTALSIPLLAHREVKALNSAKVHKNQNIGLVAPGTGLGLALLVFVDGRHRPVASEGGHASFAPRDEAEIGLWQFLRARFGHVSAERVLSGRGLVNIYDWLKFVGDIGESPGVMKAMRTTDAARVITENAINGDDPLCRAALQRFCRIFGSIAGNLALTGMTTGGLYLGGGIPPKILPAIENADFMDVFIAKGRFKEFMEKIAVRVILNDRAALLGAAHCALNL